MKNISTIKDCYGCGVCAAICPKEIISLSLNEDGFYQPQVIDIDKCINCGLCLEVCGYSHDEIALTGVQVNSFAGWSKNPAVRRKCSSGGVGFELGRSLLEKGYKVCGVKYNEDTQRAEHYIATNVKELIQSTGSKYIQSYTVDGFRGICRREKYLVTGTPCQIDSFRRMIKKLHVEDNFILMDFFCHGVPSMWVWTKYRKSVEKITGQIVYASWRNKFTGWHDSWAMSIDGDKQGKKVNWHDSYDILIKEKKASYNSRLSQGDSFYNLFLSDSCLGKACYDKCKYKYNRSSADIRIGDLWGSKYNDNEEGVSAVISFTDKGLNLLKECNCELISHPFEIVAEGQMKYMPKRSACYEKVMDLLKNNKVDINTVNNVIVRYRRINTIKSMILHPSLFYKFIIKRIKK